MSYIDTYDFLTLSCIRAPVAEVGEQIAKRLAHRPTGRFDDRQPSEWMRSNAELRIDSIYSVRPQPGGATPLKLVIWEPDAMVNFTAFYANSSCGWSILLRRLVTSNGYDALSIRTTSPTQIWQVQELQLYISGNQKRLIQLLNEEDGWHLYQKGDQLECEAGAAANTDIARRMFTRSKLLGCASALGYDFDSAEFWTTSKQAQYFSENRV